MSAVDVVTTPIHRRIKLEPDGSRRERVFVRCPRGGAWEPLEGCRRCGACAHLSMPDRTDDWLVVCRVQRRTSTAAKRTEAERTPITDAMEPSVLCVAPNVPIAAVARAMRDGDHEIAVVVDADDRPIGIVAPVDMCGARGATVGAAMTPFATALLEDAPIARALAFAIDGELLHIPILSAGRIMGLASPRSLLEWLTTPR